jgi:hypothetical protein
MSIAEKYGTKTGGIIGTLPSTIVIALLFLAINKNQNFASESAIVIPAELGINICFLVIFSILVKKSIYLSFISSISIWIILSTLLIVTKFNNIFISITIYIVSLILGLMILENIFKIKSVRNVKINYDIKKIIFRGVLAGIIITIAILLSNIGPIFSGIFSVFPAIIISTMIISYREFGPDFSSGLAKSMIIGISSVALYATSIHFTYQYYDIIIGSIISYCISLLFTISILTIRDKFY